MHAMQRERSELYYMLNVEINISNQQQKGFAIIEDFATIPAKNT
jgi:hypothetical protein